MAEQIKIRCGKCGKVLLARPAAEKKLAKCPRCKSAFTIPSLSQLAARKSPRVIVSENEKFLSRLPEKLTRKKENPLCRVVYTEASPVAFAQQRPDQAPILDLSEDGLSVYLKKDDKLTSLDAGTVFLIEIDFPVLVLPLIIEVVLRWLKPVEEAGLIQLGVQFVDPDEDLQKVILILMDFILSRPEVWESL